MFTLVAIFFVLALRVKIISVLNLKKMSSITIPHELHQRMLAEWKVEYEAEFGALDAIVEFATADEWAEHYARMIRFWTRRVPEISMTKRPSDGNRVRTRHRQQRRRKHVEAG